MGEFPDPAQILVRGEPNALTDPIPQHLFPLPSLTLTTFLPTVCWTLESNSVSTNAPSHSAALFRGQEVIDIINYMEILVWGVGTEAKADKGTFPAHAKGELTQGSPCSTRF